MCANSTTIREILLAAEELGMVDSGEYVFFSIELSSRLVYLKKHLNKKPLSIFNFNVIRNLIYI